MTTFGVFGVNDEGRRCNTIRSGTNIKIVSLLKKYIFFSFPWDPNSRGQVFMFSYQYLTINIDFSLYFHVTSSVFVLDSVGYHNTMKIRHSTTSLRYRVEYRYSLPHSPSSL